MSQEWPNAKIIYICIQKFWHWIQTEFAIFNTKSYMFHLLYAQRILKMAFYSNITFMCLVNHNYIIVVCRFNAHHWLCHCLCLSFPVRLFVYFWLHCFSRYAHTSQADIIYTFTANKLFSLFSFLKLNFHYFHLRACYKVILNNGLNLVSSLFSKLYKLSSFLKSAHTNFITLSLNSKMMCLVLGYNNSDYNFVYD